MDKNDNVTEKKSHCCQSNSTEQSTYETGPTVGKRIIDIEHMAKQMYCSSCNTALLMQNIEAETLKGLASIFKVRCHECSLLNTVMSSRQHKDHSTGRTLFDINTEAALGVMYANIEQPQINKFLYMLDVPTLSYNLYKIHEELIGPAIQEAADKSCSGAVVSGANCNSK